MRSLATRVSAYFHICNEGIELRGSMEKNESLPSDGDQWGPSSKIMKYLTDCIQITVRKYTI